MLEAETYVVEWRYGIPMSVMKETGVVVTASWYNLEHTLGLTSPQTSCAQHAIGHCLPLTGLHPSGPRGDHCCYSTWTRCTKPTHKRSQNTARVTRNSRKSNQELLPLTASNQGNVFPQQQRSNLFCPKNLHKGVVSKARSYPT